jgi:Ion channel
VYGTGAADGVQNWPRCGTNNTFSHYLASFYFVIYTMMTVGYGDIHAEKQREVSCVNHITNVLNIPIAYSIVLCQ